MLKKNKYINAKMKNIKIYSDKEIESPQAHLERKRRRFWNEKAAQLAKCPKMSHCNKTTIAGIIDVSWTMKKTSLIETEARKLLDDERELRFNEDPTSASKLGQQKKETLGKNLECITAAHLALEGHDAKVEELKRGNKSSALKREKAFMEGAYTELKKAQEAAVKSIKVKRQQVEMYLSSKMLDEGDKDETLDRSLLAPFWAFIIFSCFVCYLFSFLLKHTSLTLEPFLDFTLCLLRSRDQPRP